MTNPCNTCERTGLNKQGREFDLRFWLVCTKEVMLSTDNIETILKTYERWDGNYAKLNLSKDEIKLLVDNSILLVDNKKYRYIDGKYEVKQEGKWLSTKPPKMPSQIDLQSQPQFCAWQDLTTIYELLFPKEQRNNFLCEICNGTTLVD